MRLQPGPTMLLEMWRPEHIDLLCKILLYVDTILGVNLLFDFPYLRRFNPRFFSILSGQHTILDFIYFRYLLSELTTARSLKDYGPLHGLYSYSEEQLRLKQGRRYRDPHDPEFREYQCSDPHNSITACAHAAHSIFFEYGSGAPQWKSSAPPSSSSSSSPGSPPAGSPTTGKLSPECIDHYSSLWWTCIRLAESGIPASLSAISALEGDLLKKAQEARDHCSRYSLQLSGKGSQDSQISFINAALEAVDNPLARTYAFGNPSTPILNSKLIELTEAHQRPSAGVSNRAVISVLLRAVAPDTPAPVPPPAPQLALFAPEPPPPTTTLALLDRWNESTRAEKLVSTYTYPLLRHARTDPTTNLSTLIPLTPTRHSPLPPLRPSPPPDLAEDIGLGFPTIYAVPSNAKDTSGSGGGQVQSRLSFKNPAAPTWPPAIKACIRSRYKGGTAWVFDLSQIELRVAGILSGEPSILNNYVTGGDLHTERCIDLFGTEELERRYGPNWRKNPTFKENERQWAKAQPVSEPVATPYGWTPIGQLQLGDAICDTEGGIQRVKSVHPQGVKPIFRVVFSDGGWTRATADHWWQTAEGLLVQTRGLTPGTALPPPSPLAGTDEHVPIDPYLLGALLGDGCFRAPACMLASADRQIVAECQRRLPPGVTLKGTKNPIQFRFATTRGRTGRGNTGPLLEALIHLGLWRCTSHEKFIPPSYLTLPPSKRLLLLQGLLDTDGSVDKRGVVSFSSVSQRLATNVRELVESLGGVCRTYHRRTQSSTGKVCNYVLVRIRLSPSTPPFLLRRKLDRWHQGHIDHPPRPTNRYVKEVVFDREEQAVCIKVSHPQQLYITRSCIVTHNTFNFEDLYLAGADKMQRIFIENTNKFLPISFFAGVVQSRRRLRPVLLQWQQSVLEHCERFGYYELPFYGQSRYFIGGVACNPIGEMVNFPIQATAANVMHAIMRRLHELLPSISHPLPRIHPFLNIYDAGLIDSHPSVAKSVPALVEQAVDHVRDHGYWLSIQRHYGNTCPLAYEIKELTP